MAWRGNPFTRAILLVCAVLLAGCEAGERRDLSPVEIPGAGPWQLAARLEDGALLAGVPRGPDRRPAGRPSDERIAVIVWRADAPARLDTARLVRLDIPGTVPGESVLLGHWQDGGRDILFSVPGSSGPLHPLRGDDGGVQLLEAAGTIWKVAPGGRVSRLVADSLPGFDRQKLARRQREGLVILYWAAVPVPDPAGERVAYVTNREAVQRGEPGQAVWIVDVATGAEAPLAYEPRVAFRAEGWLGGEVVLIGDFPGIRAMDPATGEVRTLGEGLVLAAAGDGSALATAEGVPNATVVRVLRADGEVVDVAAPPADMLYVPQATFAPDGRRLLLQASSANGMARRFGVVDLERHTVHWIDPPVPPTALDGWPAWLDAATLLFTAAGAGGTSWAVPVP